MSLALLKNNFTSNSALDIDAHIGDSHGGALCSFMSSIAVVDCVFVGNEASRGGGAILSQGRSLLINSSVFMKNQAGSAGGYGEGGAIVHGHARGFSTGTILLSITSSNFYGCKATFHAGAVRTNEFIHTVIKQCRFEGNSAFAAGAILCHSGKIENSQFVCNTATDSAGALQIESNFTISHSTFTSNMAGSGGAILGEENATFACDFCTFENNSAGMHTSMIR